MGSVTADFFTANTSVYGISTYAHEVSQDIKDVNVGLYSLMSTNRLHPDLVNASTLAKGISKL